MNGIRETFQEKFEEIQDLIVSHEMPDDVLEKGKTYFTYTLSKRYNGSDTGGNFTYTVNLIGYVKRLQNDKENTLKIVDDKANELKEKMKELNIKSSFSDVTVADGIKKIQVTAQVSYNEINNSLY